MAAKEEKTVLEKAQKAVEVLYEFRDHYIEKFGLDKANQKADDVKKKMEETVEFLDQHKDEITNKAQFHFLRGRTLNVVSGYDPSAQEALSKAVKLDPRLVDAWNDLGECYWKNGDIPSAKNCFTGALGRGRNKVSLRNLSMVLRQLSGGTPAELAKLTEESVDNAKEAVQLDITDGTSWLILGNAYLKLFFIMGQNPKPLQQCLIAYKHAERDAVALGNPDLFYNRATCHKYQEEFQEALTDFERAQKLDPTWPDPGHQEQKILSYLSKVMELTQSKGKMKIKKLESFVQSLAQPDKLLGPYSGGSYTSPHGGVVKLTLVSFGDLKPKVNSEKVILGKVVCTVPAEDPVPFTFCFVDSKETCMSVSVYNIALGYGVKIGDSVAIPEPYVQHTEVDHKGQKFSFRIIRVNAPVVMVVNGKKLGLDKQAPSVLSFSAVSELTSPE